MEQSVAKWENNKKCVQMSIIGRDIAHHILIIGWGHRTSKCVQVFKLGWGHRTAQGGKIWGGDTAHNSMNKSV